MCMYTVRIFHVDYIFILLSLKCTYHYGTAKNETRAGMASVSVTSGAGATAAPRAEERTGCPGTFTRSTPPPRQGWRLPLRALAAVTVCWAGCWTSTMLPGVGGVITGDTILQYLTEKASSTVSYHRCVLRVVSCVPVLLTSIGTLWSKVFSKARCSILVVLTYYTKQFFFFNYYVYLRSTIVCINCMCILRMALSQVILKAIASPSTR